MTPSQRSRPPRGRAPHPVHSGRIAALDSGFRCVRRRVQQPARIVTSTPFGSVPPVPPASQNGRATARTGKAGGHAGEISRWVRAGTTNNSWLSEGCALKSLIVEMTTATSHPGFATSCPLFATSPFFAIRRAARSSSLSNLLKEKKKEGCEVQEISYTRAPRVTPVLPLVRHAAYFLGHELDTPESADSWQLMARDSLVINQLDASTTPSTCPRVALRVPPLRACLEVRP
ncbi:hypothetical protein R69658_04217 [Paraburkholderia aspalathi]|uniref:Uncharacterized protein n=1 Tax=Paraburkholderia aspalathi TaxID=1324617 RepID=A0ABN7M3W0_9BURK|nr:hypothetical protein R69658_04217 [Paraburkholderia aspalathi]